MIIYVRIGEIIESLLISFSHLHRYYLSFSIVSNVSDLFSSRWGKKQRFTIVLSQKVTGELDPRGIFLTKSDQKTKKALNLLAIAAGSLITVFPISSFLTLLLLSPLFVILLIGFCNTVFGLE